jgi:ketosteroid isomerase-like protein
MTAATISPATEDVIRRYVAVWSEPDPAARRAAVASLWAPDGVEFIDGKQFRGLDELETRVTGAYDAFIGNGKYTLTGAHDASAHGDIATFTVHLTEASGEAAWTARVFLRIGPDGRVQEDYHVVVKPLPPT